MIKGYFEETTGIPKVDALIEFPQFNIPPTPISFTIFTSHSVSVLLREEAERLGLPAIYLKSLPTAVSVVKAKLTFQDETTGPVILMHQRLGIMDPSNMYVGPASMLGWTCCANGA